MYTFYMRCLRCKKLIISSGKLKTKHLKQSVSIRTLATTMANKHDFCQLLAMTGFLLGTTALFLIIGALGPLSSQGSHHQMHPCIVPETRKHIWDKEEKLIDKSACEVYGRAVELDTLEKLEYYPLQNVIFFTPIPFLSKHVMSRLFHFLIADVGISFTSSDYPKNVIKFKQNVIHIEVALGYRDNIHGPWTRLGNGNVSHTLDCKPNRMGVFTCDHFHLFELGSCHHKQYIVNLFFPTLPLEEMYPGLSPLSRVSVYEIHQSMDFTKLWFVLKSVLFPISAAVWIWFRQRLMKAEPSERSLLHRLLGLLGLCLIFYNIPFDLLSIYLDCPWLLVFNDFRHGLFIAALFLFWIVFVQEHREKTQNRESQSHITTYWKEMGVVSITCTFLFIYEFCERGIQVVFPFYSLWGTQLGRGIAWSFITIASCSSLLYLIMLLVATAKSFWEMQKKETEVASLSESAKVTYKQMLVRFKFFLLLTVLVALCSIGTVVLPSEMMLHQWQHGKGQYAFYSAILTGNYGMWNAYTLLMIFLYAPQKQSAAQPVVKDDAQSLQKLLSKQSQN